VQLPDACIDRNGTFGTVLKQAIGKAARRSTDIKHGKTAGVNAKAGKRRLHLLAATPDVFFRGNGHRGIPRDLLGGLCYHSTVYKDKPLLDQALCALSAVGQSMGYQIKIESHLLRRGKNDGKQEPLAEKRHGNAKQRAKQHLQGGVTQ